MRKLVMVSLDALFDRDVENLPEDGFLRRFLSKAAVSTQVKTVFPALTYPAHVTLMTGCEPIEHGVGQNQPFQPGVAPDMRAWYWDMAHVQRETLPQAVHRCGGRVASILWPVTARSGDIRWNFPEVIALPGENQVLKMLRYGTAPWILGMELRHGRKRVSTHEPHLSDYATVLACDVIRRHQPELTLVHLVDLDEMRHHHGTHSPEAAEALRRQEHRVEDIWRAMQETPGMRDALLVLVSDHGQADVSRTVCLADSLNGDALVQSNGMTAYFFASTRGEEGLRRAEYRLRQRAAELGVSCVYDRARLDEMGCVKGPAFAAEAAPEVVFADGLPQAKRERATHGFGPGHPAENCLLAVRGAGIAPGELPAMPMRCVAPTLAALMGVDLPQASGINMMEKWG